MYKYKIRKTPKFEPTKTRVNTERSLENLTGFVNGKKASDLEERFARALPKNPHVRGFDFQVSYVAGRFVPGEISVDFVVYANSLIYLVFIDGEYAHKTIEQREEDKVKRNIVYDHLRGTGVQPPITVPFDDIPDAKATERVVNDLF